MYDGTWEFSFKTPIGKMTMDLTLLVNGSEVTGEINGKVNKHLKITEGHFDQTSISFGALMKTPVGTLPTTTTLKPDGDTLAGTISTAYGTFNATAVKK